MSGGQFELCFLKFFLTSALLFGNFLLVAQTAPSQIQTEAATSGQSKQYEEAVAYYEKLLGAARGVEMPRSTEIETRTRLATSYFMLHRYRESLQALQALTDDHHAASAAAVELPAQAWLVRGLDYLELNQPSEAILSLRRALAINSKSGTARLALGDALARSGHLDNAEREYEHQTRLTPSVPDAWYKLGLAHSQLAAELARPAKSRGSVVEQQLAAEELLAKGANWDAARAFSRLVSRANAEPQVHADLGKALLEVGYPKSAEAEFRRELALNPDCPLARFGLAQVFAMRGDWDNAISSLDALARSHPRATTRFLEFPPAGTLRQAWTEGKIQIPERFTTSPMADVWKAWLSDSGSATQSLGRIANVTSACVKPEPKAIATPGLWLTEACYQSLNDHFERKKAITLQDRIKWAEAEFRLGHYEAARRNALSVLASDSQNDWGAYWLSKAHAAMAEDCFLKVGALNPESARIHQMLAQHYASWADYSKAKAEFLAALRLAPDLPDLHLGLGSVYWHTGEWPQAEKELQKTLELTPGSAVAHYELGNVYLQQRRWQLAMTHLGKVPNDSLVALNARLDRAKVEAEMGQTRQALEDLLPLLPEDQDGEIHFRVAGLYRKLGDAPRAREALATFKRLRAAALRADHSELEALQGDQPAIEYTPNQF